MGQRGENLLCYLNILGHCSHRPRGRCNFVHVDGPEMANDFASGVCQLVGPGVGGNGNNANNNNNNQGNERGRGRGGPRRSEQGTPIGFHGGAWNEVAPGVEEGLSIAMEARGCAKHNEQYQYNTNTTTKVMNYSNFSNSNKAQVEREASL